MTKREIVDKLRSFRVSWHKLSYEQLESHFEELANAVEALPEPVPGAGPDIHGMPWPPGRSVVAMVPGDGLISLKAAIDAGARIVIEPCKPEAE